MRVHFSRRAFAVTVALALGLTGCASGGGSGDGGSRRGSTTHITAEELAGLEQFDAYQAVERLRPNWLRTRGGSAAQVIVDGSRQNGGLELLRTFRVSEIQDLRYLSARDATTRFGTGFDGGAILVTTRRR